LLLDAIEQVKNKSKNDVKGEKNMEKVLLSKEEAEALVSAFEISGGDKANVVHWHSQNLWDGDRAPLNELDLDTVCRALYQGYEIEAGPEEKVLDFYNNAKNRYEKIVITKTLNLRRLQQICAYRDAGLKLEDIRAILDRPEDDASSVLKRRLIEINGEIETLRNHQRAILQLLRSYDFNERTDMNTKEKWVSVMKAAGFTEADMQRWHAAFEKSAPEEHQEFLEFLHIPKEEIATIREWSRKG
jgi:DNA-binding transcriptional MerR regulator